MNILSVWRFFNHLTHFVLLFWPKSAVSIIESSCPLLPCVLEITEDRFPDFGWSHGSADAVCLLLCVYICLSIFWPGSLSFSCVFCCLQVFTSSTVTFPFFSVFLADTLHSLTINVHTDTFVTLLFVCALSFVYCSLTVQYYVKTDAACWHNCRQ